MSAYQTIAFEVTNGIATLALARPERLNALIPLMTEEASDALDRLAASGARVLLITGQGRAFCSGADLQQGIPEDAGRVLETHYNPFLEKLMSLPTPVITAVNGAAAGAGCALALAGDFVIAARSAYFLLAFANIGLVPDFGATWLTPWLAGKARATEMMMLGERVSAEKAEAWGMIYKVTDDASLLIEARALAQRLAEGPTRAYGLMRAAIRASLEGTLDETLKIERENQKIAGGTADFREGVAAFLEKRRPKFEGR
jgi:2-(1,2-epoxy-1,2-dihydrophenyl)acetyl-CoA isomerase